MKSRNYDLVTVDFRPIEKTSAHAAIITINNPPRNAMSEVMSHSFASACAELSSDAQAGRIRTTVLTGSPPVLSAGGDFAMLEALAGGEPAANAEFMRAFYRRFLAIREIGVPTVAAINGHAIGAGFCVACACDIRLAVPDAKLAFNFLRIGLHPGMGATYFAAKVFGRAVGQRLLISGHTFTASEAVAMGGDLTIVQPSAWEHRINETIQNLATVAPQATRRMIAGARQTENEQLNACLTRESHSQALDYAGPEFLSAIKAMRAKEKPSFP